MGLVSIPSNQTSPILQNPALHSRASSDPYLRTFAGDYLRHPQADIKTGMGSSSRKRFRDESDGDISELDSDSEMDLQSDVSISEDESGKEFEEGSASDRSGDDDGSDEETETKDADAEMEKLEQEYLNIRNQEQNLMETLKRHKDEDSVKGQAVKNQKALWDKSLEFRFLLQKAFSSANRLPQEPVRSSLCNSDTAVAHAYSDLISSSKKTLSCMLELEEALLEKNPSIVQGTEEDNKESHKDESFVDDLKQQKDEDWGQIHRMQCRIAPFRNNSVDRWHAKMQVSSGAAVIKSKLHAFNQKISDQVAGFMRDPSKMIKRMQLRRSSVGIFGEVVGDSESRDSSTIKEQDDNADEDPELLDDSEFYQQLLKEFFESCDPTSSGTTFYALKRLQTKKRKLVDRRASKSRKIRYTVHEKIVSFMAPVSAAVPTMAPKLFDNLFGRGSQKLTSVT